MPPKKEEELWITNINRFQDISLGDLSITIRRGKSINLLAKKNNGLSLYNLTRKQIEDSIKSGSIFKKGNHVKIRLVAPPVFTNRIEVAKTFDTSSIRTVRKPPEIENPEFPDLDIDDGSAEDFAAENAEMDASDRAPVLPVDPIFKRVNDDE